MSHQKVILRTTSIGQRPQLRLYSEEILTAQANNIIEIASSPVYVTKRPITAPCLAIWNAWEISGTFCFSV